jgi:uncharacterized protein (TIGR02996 family)
MNDEDAFQSALDANSEDHTTRLVFADWLQDRDDPRAEGYRALAVGRHCPLSVVMVASYSSDLMPFQGRTVLVYGPGSVEWEFQRELHHLLPKDWFTLMDKGEAGDVYWHRSLTRREAEDAAALAFANLSAERRAELLAGKGAEPTDAAPKRKPKPKEKPKGKK